MDSSGSRELSAYICAGEPGQPHSRSNTISSQDRSEQSKRSTSSERPSTLGRNELPSSSLEISLYKESHTVEALSAGTGSEDDDGGTLVYDIFWKSLAKNEFHLPATNEGVQGDAHNYEQRRVPFPGDDDSFVEVRRWLYSVLTLEAWGITQRCPMLIRVTVEEWFGTGAYLKKLIEQTDEGHLCPEEQLKAVLENTMSKAEALRYRDLVVSCVVREARRHFEEKAYAAAVAGRAQMTAASPQVFSDESGYDSDLPDIGDRRGTNSNRSCSKSRPSLPGAWSPRPRRTSSIYSLEQEEVVPHSLHGRQQLAAEHEAEDPINRLSSMMEENESEPGAFSSYIPTGVAWTSRTLSGRRSLSTDRLIESTVARRPDHEASVQSCYTPASRTPPNRRGSFHDLIDHVRLSTPFGARISTSQRAKQSEPIRTVRFEDCLAGPGTQDDISKNDSSMDTSRAGKAGSDSKFNVTVVATEVENEDAIVPASPRLSPKVSHELVPISFSNETAEDMLEKLLLKEEEPARSEMPKKRQLPRRLLKKASRALTPLRPARFRQGKGHD
ncbi:hypothetical protein EJ04DRAFT_598545 [Polyplosphaeria fusca]|uniref:Uncharacterized protein n=1 Tax=Polyplosphaeria fusca TaxID=682080 RepID=A0A9P4V493_9PLEO|nr:hypothetical protein EJ04DRAFT_598545 [Polyplosphaeria fusca]